MKRLVFNNNAKLFEALKLSLWTIRHTDSCLVDVRWNKISEVCYLGLADDTSVASGNKLFFHSSWSSFSKNFIRRDCLYSLFTRNSLCFDGKSRNTFLDKLRLHVWHDAWIRSHSIQNEDVVASFRQMHCEKRKTKSYRTLMCVMLTKDNILRMYEQTNKTPPPDSCLAALRSWISWHAQKKASAF